MVGENGENDETDWRDLVAKEWIDGLQRVTNSIEQLPSKIGKYI